MPLFYENRNGATALKKWVPYLLIFLAGFITYFQTLFFDFTYCDDHLLVLGQKDLFSSLSNIGQAFRQDAWNNGGSAYRPLSTVTFMLDSKLGNFSPLGFHFGSMMLHLISSCLFFLLLVKMKCKTEIALLFALLYTVHPALAQTVAWLPGRMDLLLGIFVFAGFISFLNYQETKRKYFFFLHVLFFCCSLFSKETAVVLPIACLLYSILILRKKIISAQHALLASGWIASYALWFICRHAALKQSSGGEPLDLLTTAYHNLPALIQQAGKILFPFNLSTLPVIEDTGFYFGIATLLILAIMAYRSKENISRIVFGLCWFLIFLLPTYSVYVSGERMHTDNRLYVPIAGLLFTVAALKPIYKINFKNLPSKIIFACIVLCFSVSTIIYSPVFENRFSFYENAAAHSPHSVLAQKGAGDNYFLKKDFNNAAAQYRKALQLSPSLVGLHTNLGLIDLNKNLPAEAEQEFKTEIQLNPQFEKGYYNLAMLYFKQKKTGEAQFYLEKTVSINPTNWKAFYLLGVIFSKQGKRKEAESCFAKAQRYKS